MGLRDGIAKMMGMRTNEEVNRLLEDTVSSVDQRVADAVIAARQAMPTNLDYDPNGDGYRRLTGQNRTQERDLSALSQDTMLELAYYLYDTSGLVKRFVRDTRNFILGEGVTYAVKNDEAGLAKAVLDGFWDHPMNQLSLRLQKRIEFLNLLGEQCWPVQVNPHTGQVLMTYVDPVNIQEVLLLKDWPEVVAAVKLKGDVGRSGNTLPAVRVDLNPYSKTYNRLVGEVFFISINNPPNASRGRSDLVHLFDFIDGFEAGLFNEIDRGEMQKSFIWDVTLEGADEQAVNEFIKNTPKPKPGAMRVHNEKVKYEAVAPDLKAADNKAMFELCKTYLSACTNRPDSWLGSGGKAYQTEADLMGEPSFKDLKERQNTVKAHLQQVLTFVIDQAIIAGTLREDKGKPFTVVVNMPEMSTKDLKKILDGMNSLAQSLVLATANKWIKHNDAAKVYASVASQTGVEVEALEEEDLPPQDDEVTDDYKNAKNPI
jgi:hypothetical protein